MTAEVAAARELNPEDFFRTDNMGMVTFLKMKGHTVQTVEWRGPTCFWNFRVTDSLLDLTEDFLSGEAVVEPQEYSRRYRETKKEFYESKNHAS